MEENSNISASHTPSKEDLEKIAAARAELVKGLGERKATERKLKIMVLSAFLVVFMSGFVLAYQYFAKLNETPKSYFEVQLRTYNSIVAAYPKSAAAHANLGFTYYQMQDYNSAKEHLEVALTLDKNNLTGNFFLGEVYKIQGKDELAIKYLSRSTILATKTRKYTAYYELGEIYEAKGDYKKAMEYYQLSIADNKTTWNAHYKVGNLYERQGKKADALKEYKQALVFNPDNQDIKNAIAKLEKPVTKK